MTKADIARIIADFTGQHQWDDMADDRSQLREFVRQGGYDVNEPTKDDCLEAAAKILTALETPTPEMLNAAVDATGAGSDMSWSNRSPQSLFQQGWSAMIRRAGEG